MRIPFVMCFNLKSAGRTQRKLSFDAVKSCMNVKRIAAHFKTFSMCWSPKSRFRLQKTKKNNQLTVGSFYANSNNVLIGISVPHQHLYALHQMLCISLGLQHFEYVQTVEVV